MCRGAGVEFEMCGLTRSLLLRTATTHPCIYMFASVLADDKSMSENGLCQFYFLSPAQSFGLDLLVLCTD